MSGALRQLPCQVLFLTTSFLRQVSARSIYDTFYPAGGDASVGSESGRESDFIDFDATTVDESLGSCELVDEFPTLAGSPRRTGLAAAAASTPCRAAAPAPELSLSPVSGDSVVASSGVLSPHRTFRPPAGQEGEMTCPPPPAEETAEPVQPPHTPPLRAMQDTFDESSSGDILELRLPDAPSDSAECQCDLDTPPSPPPAAATPSPPVLNFYGWRSAEGAGDGDGDGEGSSSTAALCPHPAATPNPSSLAAPCPGLSGEDSLKRPGPSPVSRDEYDRIWKRPRTTATADSWDETDVSAEAV